MRLLIANQTSLDRETRHTLKEHFDAVTVASHDLLSTERVDPFVLLTPPSPKLLEDGNRAYLGSVIVIAEPTLELEALYDPLFSAGVLDVLLTPLPQPYLVAKLRVLIQKAKVREVREILRYINQTLAKPLTQTEVAFLRTILSRGPVGASRDQLQEAAWGDSPTTTSRSLDTHIFNLRRKLEDIDVDIHYRRADKRWTLTSDNPKVRVPF